MAIMEKKSKKSDKFKERGSGFFCRLLVGAAVLAISACASPAIRYSSAPSPETVQAPPRTQIYFYPEKGQSMEQQERDRYECYLWAMEQTGFDPSGPLLAPHQRVVVEPRAEPGHDVAVGAVTGAVLGAIIAGPRDTGEGAAIGAIAGAVLGGISDSARQEQADRLQAQYDQKTKEQASRIEKQAENYRRAMGACLEGRGYAVSSVW